MNYDMIMNLISTDALEAVLADLLRGISTDDKPASSGQDAAEEEEQT